MSIKECHTRANLFGTESTKMEREVGVLVEEKQSSFARIWTVPTQIRHPVSACTGFTLLQYTVKTAPPPPTLIYYINVFWFFTPA